MRLLKPRDTIWKAISTKSLFWPSTTIFVGLWSWRIWALVRSGGPKSFFVIISKSIIDKTRPIKLQILFFASSRGVKPKKMSYKLIILGFFINCSLYWLMPASWASVSLQIFSHSTKSQSTKCMFCLSYNSSGICYELNWPTKGLIKSALVLWVWNSQSYRDSTPRLKKLKSPSCKEAWKAWQNTLALETTLYDKNHPF